jgi:hypothetical protein
MCVANFYQTNETNFCHLTGNKFMGQLIHQYPILRKPTRLSSVRQSWSTIITEDKGLGYGLDGPGFESRQEQEISVFSKTSRPALRSTLLPIPWVQLFSPGIKRPGRDCNHSSTSNTEVKNEWNYTCTLPVRLYGMERDTFAFTFTFKGLPTLSYSDLTESVRRVSKKR